AVRFYVWIYTHTVSSKISLEALYGNLMYVGFVSKLSSSLKKRGCEGKLLLPISLF
uniref:Methyltransferase domain-containing protein n=1 Tax=Parascaris univalens TaxID=6257 RepID=A0A914ZLZ2_PARUN